MAEALGEATEPPCANCGHTAMHWLAAGYCIDEPERDGDGAIVGITCPCDGYEIMEDTMPDSTHFQASQDALRFAANMGTIDASHVKEMPACSKCGDPEANHDAHGCFACSGRGRELSDYCDGYEPMQDGPTHPNGSIAPVLPYRKDEPTPNYAGPFNDACWFRYSDDVGFCGQPLGWHDNSGRHVFVPRHAFLVEETSKLPAYVVLERTQLQRLVAAAQEVIDEMLTEHAMGEGCSSGIGCRRCGAENALREALAPWSVRDDAPDKSVMHGPQA